MEAFVGYSPGLQEKNTRGAEGGACITVYRVISTDLYVSYTANSVRFTGLGLYRALECTTADLTLDSLAKVSGALNV